MDWNVTARSPSHVRAPLGRAGTGDLGAARRIGQHGLRHGAQREAGSRHRRRRWRSSFRGPVPATGSVSASPSVTTCPGSPTSVGGSTAPYPAHAVVVAQGNAWQYPAVPLGAAITRFNWSIRAPACGWSSRLPRRGLGGPAAAAVRAARSDRRRGAGPTRTRPPRGRPAHAGRPGDGPAARCTKSELQVLEGTPTDENPT